MLLNTVNAPVKRSQFRRKMGKRFYILKRKLNWAFSPVKYSSKLSKTLMEHSWIEHSSILLRPLAGVDMQLQENKTTNLRLALQHINGIVLQPGETFSFWKLVGAPTKSKGYLPGLVLSNGHINSDYGGGLCQLGNLIYWMTLHTPLTVTERYRHSYDVFPDVNRKLPFGSGATLAYNYIDLQIKNDTNIPFQFSFHISEERLHGAILSNDQPHQKYEVYESHHEFRSQPWGGHTRHNTIQRKVFDLNGAEISDEIVTENHAIMMYSPMLDQ